jgi:3-methylcrotonyl-CoA carboxylase alpha subunit
VGVANNADFLHRVVSTASFRDALLDTALIEREKSWIWPKHAEVPEISVVLAALRVVLDERERRTQARNSPWMRNDGWRMNGLYTRRLVFAQADHEFVAAVEYRAGSYRITAGRSTLVASAELLESDRIEALIDGQRVHATVIPHHGRLYVFYAGQPSVLAYVDPLQVAAEGHASESSLRAPMPGRVIAQSVKTGEHVEQGAPLMVLEAMKMECTIHAPAAGRVDAFHFAVGDQVTEGVELLHFEREPSPAEGE